MAKKQRRGLPHSNRRGTARHPMHVCDVCSREFKTDKGLKGHRDEMHGPDVMVAAKRVLRLTGLA